LAVCAGGGARLRVKMAEVLGSWKEIAAYLGKGVRTVQRWETELALPVHRPLKARRGIVMAFPRELDKWSHRLQDLDPHSSREHSQHNRALAASLLKSTLEIKRKTQILSERCAKLLQSMPKMPARRSA
jgi:hypothetical protein